MPRFVTCGPNEAIIVSGCCHSHPTIRAGGRVFVWPMFHRIQRMSLNTMTLNVESQKVYSEGGVPLTLKGIAQVKIQGLDLTSLRAAGEMFLDKTEDEIMDIAKATLDGHQRSMIASMKIEDIYKNRHDFAKKVQTSAQTDLIDMGLTLISYTVQDITDDEGYLDALGQEKTVEIRTEARKEIAIAKAFEETKTMDTKQHREEKEIEYQQTVALKQLDFDIAQATYLKNTHQNKAKSDTAGALQTAEMNKLIAIEKMKVIKLEKEKENEMMLKKKTLKELELRDLVEKRADFEYQREIDLANAYAEKKKAEARMEAERIRKLATARAQMIKEQKEADAEVLVQRAQAFEKFGEAAKLEMVLAILPRLTAEIAGPVTECKKITSVSQDGSVGFSRITNEILEVVEQICDSVSGITVQTTSSDRGNNNDTTRKASTTATNESLLGPSSSDQTKKYSWSRS